MSNIFHCAVEAGNLEETVKFYTDVLFCKTDNSEEGKWVDIDFWGNELTLHASAPRRRMHGDRHNVEMGAVVVPHFGVHLERDVFDKIRESVANTVGFIDEPYIRFGGTEYEQQTFFVMDPNFNVLEIKSLAKMPAPSK
ncbi:MAG: glyoxalase [Proteobacteria bacterium]|nr:glyoxalase [Pseudomonadota bacterium]MDA1330862.1 glyoxalase [Pseudomonadota bacterium]